MLFADLPYEERALKIDQAAGAQDETVWPRTILLPLGNKQDAYTSPMTIRTTYIAITTGISATLRL